jgi:hypothetical protein
MGKNMPAPMAANIMTTNGHFLTFRPEDLKQPVKLSRNS